MRLAETAGQEGPPQGRKGEQAVPERAGVPGTDATSVGHAL